MNISELKPNNQINLYNYNKVFNNFISLFNDNRLPSKILLSGLKGIGKSTLAYHLINYILSKKEEFKYDLKNFQINNQNRSFNLILKNSHPNFHLIEVQKDKKNIEIDQIRKMINYTNKSTFDNNEKIILIDGVEKMNLNSINSLLKIAEEPNEKVIFILIHNNSKLLLPTLKSRCIQFNLYLSNYENQSIIKKITNDDIENFLNKQLIMQYSTVGDYVNLINFSY
ncbi:AAA family ATPase, partial [Candidatus Pelagibacter sp.]|nr:AAA family ATPase [Candidatus Pelagibacter sp.]